MWSGVTLLALGVAMALLAIYSGIRARNSTHDAEAIAQKLRVNGAIVENYYKVLGNTFHPSSRPVLLGGYIIAGVLVAAGGVLIPTALSFPRNEHQTTELKRQNKS